MFSDDVMSIPKSVKTIFREIDVFRKENKEMRCEFLFFWSAIVCAYLSIIFSRYPHMEDYVRNALGYSCGQHGRVMTALLECPLHFSNFVFDISPFSHILSCAVLAYSSVVLKKMFVHRSHLSFVSLCFLPAAINAYLSADMLFKYDSLYMVLAILCSVLAAYLTVNNIHNSIDVMVFQVILLFMGLTLYHAALSAYFVLCLYIALIKIADPETTIYNVLIDMKGWGYTMLLTAIIYAPVIINIDSDMIYPYTDKSFAEFIYIGRIVGKYWIYLCDFVNCWKRDPIYDVFFFLVILFSLSFIYDIFKSKNEVILKILCALLLLLLFIVSPYGITAITPFADNASCVLARVLGCVGIWMSIIFYRMFVLLQRLKIFFGLYKAFLIIFSLHNSFLLNSIGNTCYTSNAMFLRIAFDISNKIDALATEDKSNPLHSSITYGDLFFGDFVNFAKTYPVLPSIMTCWRLSYCGILAHFNNDIFDGFIAATTDNTVMLKILLNDVPSKKVIKSYMWYTIYSINDVNKRKMAAVEINGYDGVPPSHFFPIYHHRAAYSNKRI
ncbi:MAG: glucosyltransferase domain-containing protein [Holosporaceae bacterium]|jgi:hypothetical protein|nr:glucosyltransferase domain-containing protein [Holosporaceae bacterium]